MENKPKLSELRPDRALLNSDFDGYKLSLTEIPTISERLEVSVDRLVPGANQYSLLHTKLFVLHNHLTGDSQFDSVLFIDKNWNIQQYTIEPYTNEFTHFIVWKIPHETERTAGNYNTSLKLVTEDIAVVSDGTGYLYLLDRGSADIDTSWRVIFSGEVIGPEANFVIRDVVYKESKEPEVHLLLLSIEQKASNERYSSILYWITLKKTDTWNQIALKQLTIDGFVQYANLERSCEAVYVVSDTGCKFTLDSDKEIKETKEVPITKKYTWLQNKEDVILKFTLPESVTETDLSVKPENRTIEIKNGTETLLSGSLYQNIDQDLTHWTFDNCLLEVVLRKSEVNLMWPEVVEGDQSGEYCPDQATIDEAALALAPITTEDEVIPTTGTTFNSQQVEECDFECDKFTVFERLSAEFHKVTHKINLGSHPVLLKVQMEEETASAFGIRSDVDTCIWQPTFEDDFKITHKGTLLALGYIQASKQQMKFFACAPDLSYSVICETSKRVFLYCQNKSIGSNELRNRSTGRRINNLALQQVFALPNTEEILGIFAADSHLYLLTENSITALAL